ncbi:MAG: hydantoinase/oxoprolinase family protein [Chloroflexi bacterium]|nr:hydantoinase/oxoprolinase family protein [Chloroflexota bacterium]
MRYRIGIDVGGTFTDFAMADESGRVQVFKTPTTVVDPSVGLVDGLRALAEQEGLAFDDFIRSVRVIVHGTTVATNAILTGKGALTGLLTTRGFRDALEMRRGYREEPLNNKFPPVKPLVPRYLRLPVGERVDPGSSIHTDIDLCDVESAAKILKVHGVAAVAVCFLHSYANDSSERQAGAVLRQHLPASYITLSCDLLPQVRLYDRVSTTVLNAYVGPIIESYLRQLVEKLGTLGFEGTLLIVQSNGGVTSARGAVEKAATTILSGPAAGPTAGVVYSSLQGSNDCITIDMGGTSFDAALVKDGKPLSLREGWINRHRIALPMSDIHTIGAGGGSIAWIDKGGLLRVGPQSAGADPGPACYGFGGNLPTCTDADLLLGYLDPARFLDGRMRLHYDLAWRAMKEHIADPLGLEVVDAAAGVYDIINVNMTAGVREVSVERGFDPREFLLVVAGGAGPVHAGMIARELEIPRVVVPRESSIFCAFGALLSNLKHDFVRTYHTSVADLNEDRYRAYFADLMREGTMILISEGIPTERISLECSVDIRYVGQYHEVNVPVTQDEIEAGDVASPTSRFHQLHDQLYGYCVPQEAVEFINLRVTAVGATEPTALSQLPQGGIDPSAARIGERQAWIPGKRTFGLFSVFDGDALSAENQVEGPAIIEQRNTTIVVHPEYRVTCDQYGNFVMALKNDT